MDRREAIQKSAASTCGMVLAGGVIILAGGFARLVIGAEVNGGGEIPAGELALGACLVLAYSALTYREVIFR